MPSVQEAMFADTPLAGDLAEGVKAIALNQELVFTQYQEAILPLDGYRFWVKVWPEQTFNCRGSLHYASDVQQTEIENYAINNVVFTSLALVNPFNVTAPNTIWITEFEGIRFAFSSRASFYRQTNLFHYRGQAVYPDMATQIVENAGQLATADLIVSNSLPLWLALNTYQPPTPGHGFACPVTLYPSFLLPLNIRPPFASVHVMDETTAALTQAPMLDQNQSHTQLVTEQVRITMHGLRNADALTLVDCIDQYSLDYGTFGISGNVLPVIRDEKRTQAELSTIAQKKSIIFEINYYQSTVRSVAQGILKTVTESFINSDGQPF